MWKDEAGENGPERKAMLKKLMLTAMDDRQDDVVSMLIKIGMPADVVLAEIVDRLTLSAAERPKPNPNPKLNPTPGLVLTAYLTLIAIDGKAARRGGGPAGY